MEFLVVLCSFFRFSVLIDQFFLNIRICIDFIRSRGGFEDWNPTSATKYPVILDSNKVSLCYPFGYGNNVFGQLFASYF